MSATSAIPDLAPLLTSTSDLVKVEAASALARLGAPEGRAALIECLSFQLDAYLCPPMAAGYLAQLGDPRGFQVIAKCFDVEIPAIRMLACKQLFHFLPFDGTTDESGNRIDVFALYDRALKDSSADIQWQALVQLREIRSPRSKKILEDYSEAAGDEQLRAVAKGILESIASSGDEQLEKRRPE
jgi:hypothetical protein